MKVQSSRLLGEATRFETLAARAALCAVTGDPAKRTDNEQIARDHLIRAETFKAAARVLNPTLQNSKTPTLR